MKGYVYRTILGILFPVVFVVLFLLIGGTEHGTTGWIGFGATLLTYILIISVPLFIPYSKSYYLFGLTLGSVTTVLFVAQFLIGLFFMIVDSLNWKIALCVEIVVVAVSAFLLLQIFLTDEQTAKNENQQQQDAQAVKNMALKAKLIADRTTDQDTKRIVRMIVDELNTCPTRSTPQTKSIDDSILYNLEGLNQAVLTGDGNQVKSISEVLVSLIKERKLLSK